LVYCLGYGLDDGGFLVQFVTGARDFLFSKTIQTSYAAYPAKFQYSIGTLSMGARGGAVG
jgi:hypothetical protein